MSLAPILVMPEGEPTGSHRGALLNSLFADHAYFRILWRNWAEVVPGKLYRSNHPMPSQLTAATRRFGLRTVVNLRGDKPCGSTTLSLARTHRLGLHHFYMAFESRGAPHRDRVLRFIEIYETMPKPALIHCKSGADRAGLAAGIAILLEGGTAAQALRQLSLRFLHFGSSRSGILDAFFHKFAKDAEGRLPFREWVEREYDERDLRREFSARRAGSFVNDRLLRRE